MLRKVFLLSYGTNYVALNYCECCLSLMYEKQFSIMSWKRTIPGFLSEKQFAVDVHTLRLHCDCQIQQS